MPDNKTRTYKGYPVYSGKKADEGLINEMIDWIIDACDYVREVHLRPIAFHLLLVEPNKNKLIQLRKTLERFAKDNKRNDKISDEIFYLITHETRPITKQKHSHLWVFADSFYVEDINRLSRKLKIQNFAKEVKLQHRKRSLFPDSWQGNSKYHSVRCEIDDLVHRASYVTKHATKDHELKRRWSSSIIPKAKPGLVYERSFPINKKFKSVFEMAIKLSFIQSGMWVIGKLLKPTIIQGGHLERRELFLNNKILKFSDLPS